MTILKFLKFRNITYGLNLFISVVFSIAFVLQFNKKRIKYKENRVNIFCYIPVFMIFM